MLPYFADITQQSLLLWSNFLVALDAGVHHGLSHVEVVLSSLVEDQRLMICQQRATFLFHLEVTPNSHCQEVLT